MSRKVMKTQRVRDGLKVLFGLAKADVEAGLADEIPRWTGSERRSVLAALRWLSHEAYYDPRDTSMLRSDEVVPPPLIEENSAFGAYLRRVRYGNENVGKVTR